MAPANLLYSLHVRGGISRGRFFIPFQSRFDLRIGRSENLTFDRDGDFLAKMIAPHLPQEYTLGRLMAPWIPVDVGWHWFRCGGDEIVVCRGAEHVDVVFIQPVAVAGDDKQLAHGCPLTPREETHITTPVPFDKILHLLLDMWYLLPVNAIRHTGTYRKQVSVEGIENSS